MLKHFKSLKLHFRKQKYTANGIEAPQLCSEILILKTRLNIAHDDEVLAKFEEQAKYFSRKIITRVVPIFIHSSISNLQY